VYRTCYEDVGEQLRGSYEETAPVECRLYNAYSALFYRLNWMDHAKLKRSGTRILLSRRVAATDLQEQYRHV